MNRIIALLTDFGLQDTYVGVMKSVIADIAGSSPLIDLTHAIPQGDVNRAAFELWRSAPYLPPGTIILVVVDPGVGSRRTAIAVEFENFIAVGPDNGVFSYLLYHETATRIVELKEEEFRLIPTSATFHGRDVFAPAAAHLAAGIEIEALGPALTEMRLLPSPLLKIDPAGEVTGEILHCDRFGNLITSIGKLSLNGDRVSLSNWIRPGDDPIVLQGVIQVELPGNRRLPIHSTFSDVPTAHSLAYTGSSGLLEIGVRDGEAATALHLQIGDHIRLIQT